MLEFQNISAENKNIVCETIYVCDFGNKLRSWIEALNTTIKPNKYSNFCDTVNRCHLDDKLDHSKESYVKIENLEKQISDYV